MMTCIILDEDPLARQALARLVTESALLKLTCSFESALQAASYLYKQSADLIFLDIDLPDISGMDFLRSMVHKPLAIVTTTQPHYAAESYELDVVDYLLKPIRFDRFMKAVIKAGRMYQVHGRVPGREVQELFYVKSGRSLVQIRPSEILFVEGLKDYSVIHTVNDQIVVPINLKTMEMRLSAKAFCRINRSYIVNVDNIQRIESNMLKVGDHEISIGEMYREPFFEQFVEKNMLTK